MRPDLTWAVARSRGRGAGHESGRRVLRGGLVPAQVRGADAVPPPTRPLIAWRDQTTYSKGLADVPDLANGQVMDGAPTCDTLAGPEGAQFVDLGI
jgi:hypothetical protein